MTMDARMRRLLRLAEQHGADAVIRAAQGDDALREAIDAFEHDDSAWADDRRGEGQVGALRRNDAGEWLGVM